MDSKQTFSNRLQEMKNKRTNQNKSKPEQKIDIKPAIGSIIDPIVDFPEATTMKLGDLALVQSGKKIDETTTRDANGDYIWSKSGIEYPESTIVVCQTANKGKEVMLTTGRTMLYNDDSTSYSIVPNTDISNTGISIKYLYYYLRDLKGSEKLKLNSIETARDITIFVPSPSNQQRYVEQRSKLPLYNTTSMYTYWM